MTAAEFLSHFPDTDTNYSTGGNCSAWRVALPGDCYVLITDQHDSRSPDMDATQVMLGIYNSRDEGEDCSVFDWSHAASYVRGAQVALDTFRRWAP